MHQVIAFLKIRGFCENLQIPRHMQSADQMTAKRHDVIHFVFDTSDFGQVRRFFVETLHRAKVSPWRRGGEFGRDAFGNDGIYAAFISSRPLRIFLRAMFFVGLTPAAHVVLSLFSMILKPLFDLVAVLPPIVSVVLQQFVAPQRSLRPVVHLATSLATWEKLTDWLVGFASATVARRGGRVLQSDLSREYACMIPSGLFGFRSGQINMIALSIPDAC